jgi:chromodomain-helicase-DNA-binding protein 1
VFSDIDSYQDAIDDFIDRANINRTSAATTTTKQTKGKFKPYIQQPDWLIGGELRQYQIDGLNWLMHGWHKDTNGILADEMVKTKQKQYNISSLEIICVVVLLLFLYSFLCCSSNDFRVLVKRYNVFLQIHLY